jgi:Protein of unknown function (DUF4007)
MPNLTIVSTQPTSYTVARHETFHLRDGWLSKALFALRGDSLALSEVDSHHRLGVGKNMAASIRYWVQATGLAALEKSAGDRRIHLRLTNLGDYILSEDPFIEDVASLWLVHLELASNAHLATFVHWAFNIMDDVGFDEDSLTTGFLDYMRDLAVELNESSVRKDVLVFLRTYLEGNYSVDSILDPTVCPLTSLGLLNRVRTTKPYTFEIGRKSSLPLSVLEYAILRYQSRDNTNSDVVSLDELRWAPEGPGRLLQLDTRAIAAGIELLEQNTESPRVRLSRTSGLHNVFVKASDPLLAFGDPGSETGQLAWDVE